MTAVEFHFNVADKLAYGCRLLRKAQAGGANVTVTAEPAALAALDQMLWSFAPVEFVAHCRADADAATLQATSVVLAPSLDKASSHGVLVNLGAAVPEGFERFERCIEIVPQAEDERLAARKRWKHYADRGYDIQRHDIASNPPAQRP
ncbi:MAG: DNA polymerase III subunit chi [Pseudomonadota bacterium]